ncbi:MAG: DMT family transporter [Kiloniellales bacterium]|nr:DMT family transporter [Kiloniellales bacterium]
MAISSTLLARARNLPAPVQGALYMTAAAFAFSWMNIAIRAVSEGMDPLQIAFFRNLFALMFMLPWLASAGLAGIKTERLKHHMLRAGIAMLAMVCWFYSVALLPLAEAVALNFTVPLFATAGAALFLGEVVRARRWSATAIGFLGVLIILRPGFAELTPVTALPVAAALFMAISVLVVKSLSRSDSPQVVVFYMNLFLTPLSLVPALFVWRWPDGEALLLLLAVGLLATLAHLALTRSYQKADASAVVPFDYARLPFVAIFAYFLFGEQPDLWTWVGAGVITASAIYIARREAQVARERTASKAASHAAEGRP